MIDEGVGKVGESGMKASEEKKGFRYQFFQRTYPTWLYSLVMVLFALAIYIWIEFFLVVKV